MTDTGEGMDEATLSRATEPFYTTKGTGKGTGLGLSMVHGVVTQSGGRLVLKSVKDQGTTVELWFPIEQTDGKALEPLANAGASLEIPHLTVLAVDDDSLVLLNMVAMLEDLGHTVFEASSGRQALEILRRETILDLVISDQAMPEMTGVTLLATARAERPNLRVILASGYAELPAGSGVDLVKLRKPFTQNDLTRVIADALIRDPPFSTTV